MRKLLGKLICRWRGHKRGRRVAEYSDYVMIRCPRCCQEWQRANRKARAK